MIKLFFSVTLMMVLSSCSQEPEDNTADKWPRQNGVLGQDDSASPSRKIKRDHVLKGYKEKVQRAKDMGEKVKQAAKKQQKRLNG